MKLFLLALLFACSQAEVEEINPFLTGGAIALLGEFPSAVYIRAPGTINSLCGGTIIDRQHVSDIAANFSGISINLSVSGVDKCAVCSH